MLVLGSDGAEMRIGEDEKEKECEVLTCSNFAKMSGREDMTEKRLRTSQNRYLLHRKYAGRNVGFCGPGSGPR